MVNNYLYTFALLLAMSCSFAWTGYSEANDAVAKPKMVVLGVGVNNYSDSFWPQLRFTNDDVRAVAGSLGGGTGYRKEAIILLEEEARRQPVMSELSKLENELSENDILVVYFSSHGSLDINAKGDLEPVVVLRDTRPNDLGASGLTHELLYSRLARIKARKKLVIFANGYAGVGKSKLSAEPTDLNARARDLTLRSDALPASTIAFFAASPGEGANEDLAFKSDVFTYFFLEGLRLGDKNTDGVISAIDAHRYAQHKTYAYRRERQRPVFLTSEVGLDLDLVGTTKVAKDEVSWQALKPTSLSLLADAGGFRWLNAVTANISDKAIIPIAGAGFSVGWRPFALSAEYHVATGKQYYPDDLVSLTFRFESTDFGIIYGRAWTNGLYAQVGPTVSIQKLALRVVDEESGVSSRIEDRSLAYGGILDVGVAFSSGFRLGPSVRYQHSKFELGDFAEFQGDRLVATMALSYVFSLRD